MKRVMAILVVLAAGAANAGPAWDAMQRGLKSYADGDFPAAVTNFDAAAMKATPEKFDPAAAAFNRANSMMKSGKMKDAAQVFEEALRTTDLGLQSKAYHNRGNAMLGVAGEQEKEQKLEDAIKSVDEAMAMYERSMMLAPKDDDPKINYELAGLKKKELEEKLKQQQQQQQNQDQNKDQNKDQQDKDKQDQQNKDQDQQNQDQDQQDKKDQQDQQQQQQQQQQNQDQQAADGQNNEQKRAEEMTPQEAAMLLDAMKQREQAQREQLGQIWLKRANAGKLDAVDKDW